MKVKEVMLIQMDKVLWLNRFAEKILMWVTRKYDLSKAYRWNPSLYKTWGKAVMVVNAWRENKLEHIRCKRRLGQYGREQYYDYLKERWS